MKNKKVFLLLNGDEPKKIPNFKDYDFICATDGAYQYLKENNIKPHFISGDFDSLNEISKDIEIVKTPDQNFTDFDKILKILFNRGFYNIDVFGASGKEQDHFLGNLHTAIQWKKKLKLTFIDNFGYYFLANKKTVITNCLGKIISLIAIQKVKKVSSKGLKYVLKKNDLEFGKSIGTRNSAIENTVKINFKKGNLFIFIQN